MTRRLSRRSFLVVYVLGLVFALTMLGLALTACDKSSTATSVELDVDRPKARNTVKPATPKTAPKPPAAKAPSTRKR
ncbi:hypothetical protein ABT264_19490 [Streptomyces virginiae]|uniref:hypothetical protein n=1 Tax=Streptomyces virginiae TaxID=1961 RepID=UPI0033287EDE